MISSCVLFALYCISLIVIFCVYFQVLYDDEHELAGLRGEYSDSDDDDVSEDFHDDIESSEEESEKVKDRDLEWDDSTLTF